MKPRSLIWLMLATLIVVVSGCSRVYTFEGVVVDGDGNPIVNAAIFLYPHDWKRQAFGRENGVTDENGGFKAGWGSAVGVEFFNMVIVKDGYCEQQQIVAADAKGLRIVLERCEPGSESP